MTKEEMYEKFCMIFHDAFSGQVKSYEQICTAPSTPETLWIELNDGRTMYFVYHCDNCWKLFM